jgi:hypothetical protein
MKGFIVVVGNVSRMNVIIVWQEDNYLFYSNFVLAFSFLFHNLYDIL